ncbi:50S ribosomal protein L29 [uncultured archaeon]|nr:50S ribosomal protein L29 [uncultured archaeon]
MTRLKSKDITKMNSDEKMKKIEELKFELVKSKGNAQKGSAKTKEIKKTIARILTLSRENKNSKVENHK